MEECQICEQIRKTEAQLRVVNSSINTFGNSQIVQSCSDMSLELSMLGALCEDAFKSENIGTLKKEINAIDNELVHVKNSFVTCIYNRKKELENRIRSLQEADRQYHASLENEENTETANT